jgi:hypothetical protein
MNRRLNVALALEMPMQRTEKPPMDRWLRLPLGLLVLVTCLRVWVGPTPVLPEARGQLYNPASQRQQVLEEARRTNRLLEDIRKMLKDHTFNVRVAGADNQAPAPALPQVGK